MRFVGERIKSGFRSSSLILRLPESDDRFSHRQLDIIMNTHRQIVKYFARMCIFDPIMVESEVSALPRVAKFHQFLSAFISMFYNRTDVLSRCELHLPNSDCYLNDENELKTLNHDVKSHDAGGG
jgi:hypothetical protein